MGALGDLGSALWRWPLLLGVLAGLGGLVVAEPVRRRSGAGDWRRAPGVLVAGVLALGAFAEPTPRLVLAGTVAAVALAVPPGPAAGPAVPWLAVVTAGGLVGVLPETASSLVLLGMLAVVAAASVRLEIRWDRRSVAAVVVAVVWTVVVDDHRTTALIGGLGCLGMLLALPLVDLVRARLRVAHARAVGGVRSAGLMAVHVAAVWVAARVGGVSDSTLRALMASLGGLILCTVAALVLTRPSRHVAGAEPVDGGSEPLAE